MTSYVRFVWNHTPRWAVGLAVATPVVAVAQGSLLLGQFRKRHRDAPFPVSPSRGVVVAIRSGCATSETDSQKRPFSSSLQAFLQKQETTPPLRILVIGDSLAAGVGVSQHATPVLPESIAQALSQKLGGRPVYWTCVGTPGASASQIVLDIESYEDSLLVSQTSIRTKPSLLPDKLYHRRERLHAWWRERQKQRETQSMQDNKKDDLGLGHIEQWLEQARSNIREFREAWQGPTPAQDCSDSDDNQEKNKEDTPVDPFQMWQQWKQRLRRRTSLKDPEIVGQYDVAIVLTGLNDVKEAFLPFMISGRTKDEAKETDHKKGLKDELLRVLTALQSKMTLALDQDKEDSKSNEVAIAATAPEDFFEAPSKMLPRQSTRRRPLVVFPALPVSPIPVFQNPPLSWFVVPLIHRVDQYKKVIAHQFPGEVLFVDPPSNEDLSAFESGKGPLWNDRQVEQVLLNLTDVTQRAKERVEELMKEHYKNGHKLSLPEDESPSGNSGLQEESFRDYEKDRQHNAGHSMVSADNVHPNDEGYEFWGRHIAAAIIREWQVQDEVVENNCIV